MLLRFPHLLIGPPFLLCVALWVNGGHHTLVIVNVGILKYLMDSVWE